MKSLCQKTALILIGLTLVIGATLISPALHEIGLAFPDADPALLPLVVTLPSLTLVAGLAISSALSSKISARSLILLGLALIVVGGIAPAFMSDLLLIIIMRGIVGVGMGIIVPLQMTLFAEYPERECATLIGCNSAVNCVISVIFFAAAGRLALRDWQAIFYLYAVFLPIMLLTVLFIPKRPPSAPNARSASGNRLPAKIFIYCGFVAGAMVTFYVIMTNMAFYLHDYQLGDAAVLGTLTAAGTAGSALGAFVMPAVDRLLKQHAVPINMAAMAAGFLLLTKTDTLLTVGAGYVLLFFCQGIFGCLITFKFTQLVALEQVPAATSCYMTTVFVSQFLAPYLMLTLQKLPSLTSMHAVFTLYAAIMAAMTLLYLLIDRQETKRRLSEQTL